MKQQNKRKRSQQSQCRNKETKDKEMNELATLIKASYACIQIVTHEEERAVHAIKKMASKDLAHSTKRPNGYAVWTWSVTKGLQDAFGNMVVVEKPDPNNPSNTIPTPDKSMKSTDPTVALHYMMTGNVDKFSVIIMKDFHMQLKQSNPTLFRLMKEVIAWGRRTSRHLIIVGCQLNVPPELEKEIHSIEMPLPDRTELAKVAIGIAKSAKIEMNGHTDAVIEAMTGLTTNEASDAASFSISKCKRLDPEIINQIKTDTIRKNGIVEIVDANVSLDDIGGLNRFKQHLISIAGTFTKEARDYGLPQPASLITVGQAGTGKSMSAMACKTVFNIPLIRLEAGRLFGGLVGESERNWRTAFATTKAISPVILWIDEAEGLFSGMKSSGQCDGGTTGRVIKAILQDMQMNSEGVLFIFTSNDIDGFPDPLIDRCDVWSFELPTLEERHSIWSIHIKKRKRNPKLFDLGLLAEKTEGFSGRQIEQAWVKSMTLAYNDSRREPVTEDVEKILETFVPTSITMKQQIERRRERLKNRAQSAS